MEVTGHHIYTSISMTDPIYNHIQLKKYLHLIGLGVIEDALTYSIRSYHNGSSLQELLDLGEAVGTHSRGLSKDLIKLLPVSKYKSDFFFSRRKSQCDRCVIYQMKYKRGEKQITLPCKHAYNTDCGTKWLSINKACPICYTEVFGEKSKS
ncbi:RING-type E3 ubiquitin transferase [Ranunculus cassubicifolius]